MGHLFFSLLNVKKKCFHQELAKNCQAIMLENEILLLTVSTVLKDIELNRTRTDAKAEIPIL